MNPDVKPCKNTRQLKKAGQYNVYRTASSCKYFDLKQTLFPLEIRYVTIRDFVRQIIVVSRLL